MTKLYYLRPENVYLEISLCTAISDFLFIQFHSILAYFSCVIILLVLASFNFMGEIRLTVEEIADVFNVLTF